MNSSSEPKRTLPKRTLPKRTLPKHALPKHPLGSVAIVFVLSFVLVCNASGQERFSGTTMGPVRYNVTVPVLPAGINRGEVESSIQIALDDVNDRMSTYKEDSEVSRFNRYHETEWFEVSEATYAVVARSIELSEETDGAFDITVAPLVNLWSFGSDHRPQQIPSDEEIEKQLNVVGYRNLEVRDSPFSLRKKMPQLTIDLSAIAKGYAVDIVAQRLDDLKIDSYMVEVGGEVRTKGKNPKGTNWIIGVESPTPGLRALAHRVSLDSASLATSGDYRNFFEVDGVRYSHTIDPRIGRPIQHNLSSVSVIADDCMTADALATAMIVVGPEQVRELSEKLGVEALWMTVNGQEIQTQQTDEFPVVGNSATATQDATSPWPMIGAAVLVFVVALIGMSVGVIFSNREIKGSCGGLAALKGGDGKSPCEICENRTQCDDYREAMEQDEPTANPTT